jgi:23S rRNA pseudouridine1911/1915/1917 synthase
MDKNPGYKVNIPISYEDPWFLIVDKPSGLLTIPAPDKKSKTLTEILNADLREKNTTYRLHPCHRLDRETSGLIIYAKGKSIQKKMMQEFKDKKIKKTYVAFVQGKLFPQKDKINNRIQGQSALTEYQVIERRRNFTVLKVNPLTGRKNQIRIHFKQINHPIVGEDRFSFRKDFSLKFKRLCLHAKELEFEHPITKRKIWVNSEMPCDLKNFLTAHP